MYICMLASVLIINWFILMQLEEKFRFTTNDSNPNVRRSKIGSNRNEIEGGDDDDEYLCKNKNKGTKSGVVNIAHESSSSSSSSNILSSSCLLKPLDNPYYSYYSTYSDYSLSWSFYIYIYISSLLGVLLLLDLYMST